MSAPSLGDDDHPLLFQLRNIRAALAQCQDETHASAVRFQRHSLDNAQCHERAAHLQRENDLLKAELAVLRAAPAKSDPASESKAHIQELTLSLRRLSHKLTLAEEVLLDKTKALLNTQANVAKAQAARDAAIGLVGELRAREETERITMRDIAVRVRRQDEELRMSDVVIREYAELVRQLEARSKTADQANADPIRTKISTLDSALPNGRFDLQQVIASFRSQYDETCQELEKTRGELELARSQLLAKQQAEQAVMEDFAIINAELDQLKINDGTAAKMVARYMQFSQSSTNSLLVSLEALKTRHAATTSTLSSQNQLLLTQIRSLELQNEHLRSSLDELGGEVQKEKYGRRREIGLRIRMGGREQRIVEGLRRWVRQSDEAVKRLDCQAIGAQGEMVEHQNDALLTLSQDARIFLDSLEHGGADEETAVSLSGPRARELMVCGGVDELLEELRIETERRLTLQIRENDLPVHMAEQDEFESRECIPQGDTDSKDEAPSLSLDDQVGDETTALVAPSSSEGEDGDGSAESGLSPVEAVILPQPIVPSPPSSQYSADDSATIPDQMSTQVPGDSRQPEADKDGLSHTTDEILIVEPPSHTTETPLLSPLITNGSSDDSLPTPVATHVQADVHTGSLAPVPQEGSSMSPSLSPVDSDPSSLCQDKNLPDSQEMLDVDVTKSLSSSTSEISMRHIPEEREEPHTLLVELAKLNKRYDVIQREFRDCHLALEGLKASLTSLSTSQSDSSSTHVHSFPVEFLRPAVARLDDFTEDVRVELEIKIGDEALLIKGYEALLQVPGALCSFPRSNAEEDPDIPSSTTVEQQIRAFVDGTDPTVKRTAAMFKAKLEDVQHDIAVLKRAIHDPESIPCEQLFPTSASSSSTSLASMQKIDQGFNTTARPVGGGWSSWIRNSSSPSPGFVSSPTFGSLMTSPISQRPPSQTSGDQSHRFPEGERPRGLSILGSFVGLTAKDVPPLKDPLSMLGLRIAMPNLAAGNGLATLTPMSGSMRSPSYPSNLGVGPPPPPRPRTSSSVYMLGLGGSGRVSRTASFQSNGGMDNGVKVGNDTEDAGRTSDHDVE